MGLLGNLLTGATRGVAAYQAGQLEGEDRRLEVRRRMLETAARELEARRANQPWSPHTDPQILRERHLANEGLGRYFDRPEEDEDPETPWERQGFGSRDELIEYERELNEARAAGRRAGAPPTGSSVPRVGGLTTSSRRSVARDRARNLLAAGETPEDVFDQLESDEVTAGMLTLGEVRGLRARDANEDDSDISERAAGMLGGGERAADGPGPLSRILGAARDLFTPERNFRQGPTVPPSLPPGPLGSVLQGDGTAAAADSTGLPPDVRRLVDELKAKGVSDEGVLAVLRGHGLIR